MANGRTLVRPGVAHVSRAAPLSIQTVGLMDRNKKEPIALIFQSYLADGVSVNCRCYY
jgi:hypothetical protein